MVVEEFLSPEAQIFMIYNYGEVKDLMVKFLTLSSGTLVASIAFSEKITKTHEADHFVRRLMFATWSFLLISLVIGGASVIYIAAAGGCVIYDVVPFFNCDVGRLNLRSVTLGLLAGLAYGLALVCMAVAAGRSVLLSS